MHCPNCGNESDLDQKFCRKCGFNLVPVSRLVLNGRGDADAVKLDKAERDKLIMQHMVRWMMSGMLVLLIGVIVTVIGKTVVLDPVMKLIGSLLILGGVSATTYGVLDALRGGGLKKQKPEEITGTAENETADRPMTRELEERMPIPIGSVTERTTQLIAAESDRN